MDTKQVEKITCLLCKGCGKIEKPESYWEEMSLRKKAVKRLRKEGFSYGQIMKLTGIKHKRSVARFAKEAK